MAQAPTQRGEKLERTLGLGLLAFYGVGLTLGAGIYTILGVTAGVAGEAVWMAVLLGSIAAALTGLAYAELAAMLPRAGAEYVYAREAWPRAPWLSGPLGFVLFASSVAGATTVSLAFAGYAGDFIELPAWIVAVALLVLAALVNLIGVQTSSRLNVLFTLVETAGLVALVVVGLREPDFFAPLAARPHAGVLEATGLVFFAFLGFEGIARLAGDTRDPGRNLPRAILIAIAVTTLLYLMVALAAVTLLEPARLARSDSPLADAMRVGAPRLAGALGGVALFSTANTALILMLGASRMLFGMAEGDSAPPVFAGVVGRRRTPVAATLAALAGSLALLPLGGVEILGSVASLAAMFAFLVVNLAVVWLRRRRPRLERPFRVPLAIAGVPVPAVLAVLLTMVLMSRFEARAWLVFALVLALGQLIAWWGARRARS